MLFSKLFHVRELYFYTILITKRTLEDVKNIHTHIKELTPNPEHIGAKDKKT
jgi:hypothetical protein